MRFFFQVRAFFRNLFADIRYFFLFGIGKGLGRIGRSFSGFFRGVWSWLSTFGVRRKVAQRERAVTRPEAKETTKAAVRSVGSGFVAILTSPFRFLAWFCGGIWSLRKLSLRDAFVVVWRGYKRLIGRTLVYSGGLHHGWQNLHPFLRVSSIIVLIVGILGLAASPWILSEFKRQRSEMIYAEAKTLEEEGRLVEAFQKARAAALLRPEDKKNIDLAFDLAKEAGHPEILWWSERKAALNGYDAESISDVIEIGALQRQRQIAFKYSGILKERFPDEVERIRDADLILKFLQGQDREAAELALTAYQNGADSEIVLEVVAGRLWRQRDASTNPALQAFLERTVFRDDELGLAQAVQLLASFPEMKEESPFEPTVIVEQILNHPKADERVKGITLAEASRQAIIPPAEANEQIASLFDWEDSDEREIAIELFRSLGRYDLADSLFQTDLLARDDSVGSLYLEKLIFSDEPDLGTARRILAQPAEDSEVQLSRFDRSIFRTVLALKDGDSQAYLDNLRQALGQAGTGDWRKVESIVAPLTSGDQTRDFYRESFQRAPNSSYLTSRYLNYLYSIGADKDLEALLPQIDLDTLKPIPSARHLAIYLKTLYGIDMDECRRHAEELAAENPDDGPLYFALAFTYNQSGAAYVAGEILRSFPVLEMVPGLAPHIQLCLVSMTGRTDFIEDPSALNLERERELYRQTESAANNGDA